MEGIINGSLRVLSRSSSSSSGVTPPPTSFPISLTSLSTSLPPPLPSSSFLPFTSSPSSFAFPSPLPSHTLPSSSSLPPPCPALPALSLISASSVSAAPFSSTNTAHSGAKISILTSTAVSSSIAPLHSAPSGSTSSTPSILPPPHVPPPVETPCSTTPLQGSPAQNNGVVVVGAIGRGEEDVSQLLNRILDARVFGAEGKMKSFSLEKDCTFKESEKQEGNIIGSTWQPGPEKGRLLFLEEGLSEDTLMEDAFNESIELKRGERSQHKDFEDSGNTSMGKSRDRDMEEGKYEDKLKQFQKHKRAEFRKREEWMKHRLNHYYDEEKGVVYVQFTYGSIPTQCLEEDIPLEGLPHLFEQSEANSLRGLLYMFSVCHVILFVQDGVRVDTRVLRLLRTLQNAKHMLAPFVKTQVLPGLLPSPAAPIGRGSSTRSLANSANNSPGRSGIRNASTIALMSGSAPSLFPGQCTPVLLFVFLEDFLDSSVNSLHHSSHHEDGLDVSGPSSSQGVSGSQLSGPSHAIRQTLHAKASNPVVMLARSINKTEGGLRKKLQSSLEAQIRFLIKKCRIQSGSGDVGPGVNLGMGPRGPGSSIGSMSGTAGSSALFVLDTTRVAFLIDRGTNRKGEALDAALAVIEDMLRGKDVPSNALEDLTGSPSEDVQAIKDFLWRQADILRGRGGLLTNSTGGSVGVGMVAAAAAAAAASAAAGSSGGSSGVVKPLSNPPELPSMTSWLSACQILVVALAAGEVQTTEEGEKGMVLKAFQGSRNPLRKGLSENSKLPSQGRDALRMTLNCLECGMGLDMKFSAAWCSRIFPTARDVYLKGLPLCYPTSVHISHLEKALRAFKTMVRGPAVPIYAEKLKEECEAVWKSGRQLCDAVSLTGNPCIHQVHEVALHKEKSVSKHSEANGYPKMDFLSNKNTMKAKPHSSGKVFLHACACGRSRRLRKDPFDYESANVTFFQFSNCESLLPSLIIPDCVGNKPLGGSAWSLYRLGNARYYQPSVGLLQSGFCAKQNFLPIWTVIVISGDLVDGGLVVPNAHQQDSAAQESHSPPGGDVLGQSKPNTSSQAEHHICLEAKLTSEKQLKEVEKVHSDGFGAVTFRETLDNKKAFANVVSWGSYEVDLAFPPLQHRRGQQALTGSAKNVRQTGGREKKDLLQPTQADQPVVRKAEQVVTVLEKNLHNLEPDIAKSQEEGTAPSPSTLSKSAPDGERLHGSVRQESISLYVGFEHECPHGHRFLLSSGQLDQLGSVFAQDDEFLSRTEYKVEKAGASVKQAKHDHKAFQSTDFSFSSGNNIFTPTAGKDSIVKSPFGTLVSNFKSAQMEMKFPGSLGYKALKEGVGEGYELLNRNLPVYMNCPYCIKNSEQSKRNDNTFAGTISQLQRIFVVTPPFPFLVAACPVVQFSRTCIPDTMKQFESVIEFSLGCNVLLPPDSFLSLRLPFIYFTELDSGARQPLICKSKQPEHAAWLLKGSTLKVITLDERAMPSGNL